MTKNIIILFFSIIFVLSGCNGGDSFSSLGGAEGSGAGGPCDIASVTPDVSQPIRIAATGQVGQKFVAIPTSSKCVFSFFLNGVALGSPSANPSVALFPANLSSLDNTLLLVASDGTRTVQRTWIIKKNTLPVCSSQVPNQVQTLGVNSTLNLTGYGTDAEFDSLSFRWKNNGVSIDPSIGQVFNAQNASTLAFTPRTAQVGQNTLQAEIFDGYDYATCVWNVTVINNCSLSSFSPASNTPRISAQAGTSNTFTAVPSDATCAITWTLNGSVRAGDTSTTEVLPSSAFSYGNNVLTATLSNGSSTVTKTWNVYRNSAPSCQTQVPAASGVSGNVGSPLTLLATGSDLDSGDSLSFVWTIGGIPVNPTYFVTSSPTPFQSQGIFTPQGSNVGASVISTLISDGLDSSTCTWNIGILNNCSFTSGSPAVSTVRVAAAAATHTTFAASSNDPSCLLSWKLNGVDLGVGSAIVSIPSSQLQSGANSLVATARNSLSSSNLSWVVNKNTPPVCASQSPVGATSLRVGSTGTFVVSATDADLDSPTFSWTNNGGALNPTLFSVTHPSTSSSLVVFSPNSAVIGSHTLVASIFDGYDTTSCSWPMSVLPSCTIAAPNPNLSSTKVAAAGTTQNSFSASVDSSCTISWSLNGVDLHQSGSSVTLQSLAFSSGVNTLVMTAQNSVSSNAYSWSVLKNSPPACGLQTPVNSPSTIGVASLSSFRVDPTDSNNDSLTFAWTLNGSAVTSPSIQILSPSSASSLAQFTPLASQAGSNTLSVMVSDGLDSVACSWPVTVQNNCNLNAFSPIQLNPKVSAVGSTQSVFSVTPNDASCSVVWQLNGSARSETTPSLTLQSSDLAPGNNTLTASLSNATSSSSKTWQVLKNSPPSCSVQSPNFSGNMINVGSSIAFSTTASDLNSDFLSFSWMLNGNVVNPALFTITSPGLNQSQAVFTPTASQVGANTVVANISDGLDTSSCSWSLNVVNNCTITGTSPSQAVTVSNVGATSTPFAASTNSGCVLSWTLNGTALGSTASIQNILSSQLSSGVNSLIATSTNGLSTAQYVWTINKNTPPTCGSQSPSPSGSINVGVGSSLTLVASIVSANPGSLSYQWKSNGNSANPSQFAISQGVGSTQAIFTPNSSYVGNNNISVLVSDGYDSVSCSWPVAVAANCAVSSASPSVSTTRIPATSGSANFAVVPNDSSCQVTWRLNGNSIGGVSNFQTITSSQLSGSSNTLVATLANGIGNTASQTWVLAKNNPPTCSLQTALPLPASNMLYTDTKTFSSAVADADGDSMVSFNWLFNGGTSISLFPPGQITSTASSSSAVFRPTLSEVGSGRVVSVQFSDGYDTGICQWNLQVDDPNSVLTINSCNPYPYSTSPGSPPSQVNAIVIEAGGTTNFSVNATGTLLTYQWSLNGSSIGGATSSSYSVPYSSLGSSALGYSTLTAMVTDTYGSTGSCVFTVKKNFAPTFSSSSPSNSSTSFLNISSTLALSVSGVDDNNDSLVYRWSLDGQTDQAHLPSGSSSTSLSPSNLASLVGNHVVTATVTDPSGASASRTWNVNVNYFSSACNGLAAGRICTLAGSTGIGDGLIAAQNQNAIRVSPEYVIDDGSGNIFFSDSINHVVGFYNRSNSTVTRVGKTILAGQVVILSGNGSSGRNEENLGYTYTQNKLSTPRGLAYDSTGNRLFISDNGNHRVVMLTSTGAQSTVLGVCPSGAVCSSTQNAGANTDGSSGTSHVCANPNGIWFDGSSSLYVACTGSFSVKKLDLSSMNGYLVLGKLTSGSATQVNPPTDGTLGSAGTGQNYAPYDLKGDPYRSVLYLSDAVNGAANRIRVINMSGSALNYFTPVLGNSSLSATDSSASPLSAANWTVAANDGSLTNPIGAQVVGPSNLINGNCYPLAVYMTDGSGAVINANSAFNFSLGIGAGATGTIYSDTKCTAGATSSLSGSIGAGASSFFFSYKPSSTYSAKSVTLARTSGVTVTLSSYSHTSTSAVSATALSLIGPSSIPTGFCQLYLLTATGAGGQPGTLASAKNIVVDDGSQPGTFYSDSTCSTPLSLLSYGGSYYPYISFPSGSNAVALYYRKPLGISVPANSVKTLMGGAVNDTSIDSYDLLKLGQVYGIMPWFDSSTQALLGIFATSSTRHIVSYINFLDSDVVLGKSRVRAYESNYPIGVYNSASYNGEDYGNITKLNTPRGVAINNSTNSELIISDWNNNRIRALDISVASGLTNTLLGAGYRRSGLLTDATLPAPQILMNQPSHLFFSSAKNWLYFSDAGNARVRAIDLTTGLASTIIGTGQGGDGSVDNQNPLAVLMRQPQGIIEYGASLVYNDYSSGNCLLRAYNPTSSTLSFMGSLATIVANSVSTVGGNLSLGCLSWPSSPANVSGTSALQNHLNNLDALATDGSRILISSISDHCIESMDSNGGLYQLLGTCGTSGSNGDGLANSGVLLSFPNGIAMDPAYPGNFFFVDQWNGTSKIRYANFLTSTLSISGISIPAAVGGAWAGYSNIPYIKTLYSGTASGAQRWNGVAAFDKWICFSGGQASQTALWSNDGNSGSHNIFCKDRTTTNSIRFGLDETTNPVTTRGGTTLGSEQEGIDPALLTNNQVRFNAPYGLTFDSSGNLYIAERNGHSIRKIARWW